MAPARSAGSEVLVPRDLGGLGSFPRANRDPPEPSLFRSRAAQCCSSAERRGLGACCLADRRPGHGSRLVEVLAVVVSEVGSRGTGPRLDRGAPAQHLPRLNRRVHPWTSTATRGQQLSRPSCRDFQELPVGAFLTSNS